MKLPHRPYAVIFDMDGVIFDTERLYQKALSLAVTEAGCDITDDMLLLTAGLSWADCRAMLHDEFSSVLPVEDLVESWLRHYDALAEKELPLKPGVLELLDTLDGLGLPRAIATSAYREDVQRNLDAWGIAGRFDVIVAHGDYAAAKPAPDAFLLAAKRLNIEPSLCLALEDSLSGVRSASSAGLMTVMVPDTLAASENEARLCICIANDLHQVRAMLEVEA